MTSTRTLRSRLEEIADAAKRVYALEYSCQLSLPTSYQPSKKWDKTWPKLAQFVADNRVRNLYGFITVQFAPCERPLLPTPQQCYGPVALSRWLKHEEIADERQYLLADAFWSQRRLVAAAHKQAWLMAPDWTRQEIEQCVIGDDTNQLTPLFRYSLASALGNNALAGHYLERALRQYLASPQDYDESWPASWIPQELRRLAAYWLGLTEDL